MPTRLPKFYFLKVQRVFRRLARAGGTPHNLALGAAIGMFVGMTPTVGMQMALCIPVCLLLRANPLAAVPMVWITNPLTLIPIYSFNYWIGKLIVGGPGIGEFKREMGEVVKVAESEGARAAFSRLFGMGVEILEPLLLGCSVVGVVLAVPTYFLMLRLVEKIRQRVIRRRAERQARLKETLLDENNC
jgi:uncharacterized protein (DUF2062 family)